MITFSVVSFSQEKVQITFQTGDKELNTHLSDLNTYAKSNMESFRKDMYDKFGVSNEQLDQLIIKERREPADVYYGYNLSQVTGKPFPDIIKMRTDKKGWGAVAKDLGVKPGSKQFKALKNSSLKNISKDRFKNNDIKKIDDKNSKLNNDKMKQSDSKIKDDKNLSKENSGLKDQKSVDKKKNK